MAYIEYSFQNAANNHLKECTKNAEDCKINEGFITRIFEWVFFWRLHSVNKLQT